MRPAFVLTLTLLLATLPAWLPTAATAQNPPACPDTHYQCSPGVCCPK